jgi:O-methyltransferase
VNGHLTLPDPTRDRQIRTDGPAPDAEAMRRSYLELLQLALCDLGGAEVLSVEALPGGSLYWRRLPQRHLEPRVDGRDWPWNGLSMAGLRRLDDLRWCVDAVVADGIEGDLIEAGTWRGGAAILMRAALDSLGVQDRTVWVADSFEGFPGSSEVSTDGTNILDYTAVSLDEVRSNFARLGLDRGVRFVPGFFAETMPKLRGRRWSLVRLDGDTYEATMDSLEALYPGLAKGGFLIIDDYGAFEACHAAVEDFRSRHAITEPMETIDWTGVRWRRETDPAPVDSSSPDVGDFGDHAGRAGIHRSEAQADGRIPSVYEIQLIREIAELRSLLAGQPTSGRRLRRAIARLFNRGGSRATAPEPDGEPR